MATRRRRLNPIEVHLGQVELIDGRSEKRQIDDIALAASCCAIITPA